MKTIQNRLPFRLVAELSHKDEGKQVEASAVLPFFDLAEIIPQEGGFFVPNIERNELDVYEVEMSE